MSNKKNIDIIHVHSLVIKYFEDEIKKCDEYDIQIVRLLDVINTTIIPHGFNKFEIDNTIDSIVSDLLIRGTEYEMKDKKIHIISYKQYDNMLIELKRLNSHVRDLSLKYNEYMNCSTKYIEEYREYLKKPVKNSFLVHKQDNQENVEYNKILNNYKKITCSILDSSITNNFFIKTEQKDINIDNIEKDKNSIIVYDDLSRLNFVQRCKYERKVHFKDVISQYQGHQLRPIPQIVIDNVKDMIFKHNLANKEDDESDNILKMKKYSNVSKKHISLFLKETGCSEYLPDKQLIYSKITGKPSPNIQVYEKKLTDDFDLLLDVFMKLPNSTTKRKNFLNSQYVLKQLLRKHNIQVLDDDLSILKTAVRLREHDELYGICCDKLGWNFIPIG